MTAIYLEGTAALLLAACAIWLARWVGWAGPQANGRRRACLIVAVVMVLALVRVEGISAARLVLTLSPSLSIVTLALGVAAIGAAVWERPLLPADEWLVLGGFVLAISVPLFGTVFGLWSADLYALGYRFSWVYVAVAALGMIAAWRGYVGTAVIILAAMLLQYASLLPSANLFDALTDGIASLLALALVMRTAAGWLVARRRALA
jgi:hypothetical protein